MVIRLVNIRKSDQTSQTRSRAHAEAAGTACWSFTGSHCQDREGKIDPRLSIVNRILEALRAGEEKRCRDVMTKVVIFARPNESVLEASEVMLKNAVSQLPVLHKNQIIGTITEENIIRNLKSNLANEQVVNVMDPPLPAVPEETALDQARGLLEKNAGLLVKRGKTTVGIITRSDLLRTIE